MSARWRGYIRFHLSFLLFAVLFAVWAVAMRHFFPDGYYDCLLNDLLHLYCPLCGGTRAFLSLLRFDLAAAFGYNPGVMLLIPVAFALEVRALWLLLWKKEGAFFPSAVRRAGMVYLIAYSILRNTALLFGFDLLRDQTLYWQAHTTPLRAAFFLPLSLMLCAALCLAVRLPKRFGGCRFAAAAVAALVPAVLFAVLYGNGWLLLLEIPVSIALFITKIFAVKAEKRRNTMLKYQVFSENEWVYPDSEITLQNAAVLHAARGGDVCFQVLTDHILQGGEAVSASFACEGCEAVLYQLLPAHVSENSGVKTHTTQNYDEVKDFVTRKAPFDVYEVTKPVEMGLEAGRAAFFVRINVAKDAPVGKFEKTLTITLGDKQLAVPVVLTAYNVQIPALKDATYHMINWLYYPTLLRQHHTERGTDKYLRVLRNYMENQLDMRNDYLMIPSGEPVKDEQGKVIDFDFSHAELVGNMALEMGFTKILGGFSIEWLDWKSADLYLLWDKEIEVKSIEGYRQLKLYFTRANEAIERNGWRACYQQCIMDEPQFYNSTAYRIVGAICRKCIPGVVINDPVESTDLAGGLDVWVVKQAVYEKYLADFQALQAMGEEMWIYTCGFPANKVMNRVIDLPLNASRLPMWMCYKYNCPGFLHWGYHCHNAEERGDTCYKVRERRFPAGNAHVVYLAEEGPLYSVRGHSQRTGAQDYELLKQLGDRNKEQALALIDKVCRTFDDYTPSAAELDDTRRQLLEALG